MNIHLRLATIDDLSLLQYWDKQAHVIAASDDDWDWENELPYRPEWREQLIAELNGKPIGFIQIIDPALEETHYWGDVPLNLKAIDIWIGEKENLGKGYGTKMMQLAFERCFVSLKVNAILIDPLESNKAAHRFYKRLGFEFIERRNFDGDDCFVFRLDRSTWELKHKK